MLIRLPLPLRRWLAAFASVTVLLAPVEQLAHAQAMVHVAADCAPAMDHHAPASPHHAPAHQHGGTCCDFCGTGCASPEFLATPAASIATLSSARIVTVLARTPAPRATPPAHLLPFALAPPLSA